MKQVMDDMMRIEVIDESDEEEGGCSDNVTTPNRGDIKTPERVEDNTPSCSGEQYHTPTDNTVTPPGTNQNAGDMSVSTRDVVTPCDTISTQSVTQPDKLPSVLSSRELYENFDKIPRPSYWVPETIPETEKEEEVDDFEYLGTLDDGYLLSLFEEGEEDTVTVSTGTDTQCTVLPDCTVTQTTGREEDTTMLSPPVPATPVLCTLRRSNPPRAAKLGVVYTEDTDNLEEILQSEYCKFLLSLLASLVACTIYLDITHLYFWNFFPDHSFCKKISWEQVIGVGYVRSQNSTTMSTKWTPS